MEETEKSGGAVTLNLNRLTQQNAKPIASLASPPHKCRRHRKIEAMSQEKNRHLSVYTVNRD